MEYLGQARIEVVLLLDTLAYNIRIYLISCRLCKKMENVVTMLLGGGRGITASHMIYEAGVMMVILTRRHAESLGALPVH